MELFNTEANLTLSYDQDVQPYHQIIAKVVDDHCEGGATRILELGCGVGHNLAEIRKLNSAAKFYAIDIDPQCLSICAERVDTEATILFNLDEELEQQLVSITKNFDVVVISHTLHYDPDAVATLRFLLRCLSPSGILIFATPNPFTLAINISNLIGKNYTKGIMLWDTASLKNLIENYLRMQLLFVRYDYVPLPLLSRFSWIMPFQKYLVRVFPRLSFSLIACAKKKQ